MNHEVVSARVLAKRFAVTVRTIQRDMESLALAGIPVVSSHGPQGGYSIMDTYRMSSQLMSAEDIYFIVTSLKSLSDTFSDRNMEQTLEKMKTLVPSCNPEFLEEKKNKISIDFTLLGGLPKHGEVLRVVRDAVESERLLRFSYTGSSLTETFRTVEPLTAVFKWRSWYLFAWCRLRQDYRLFRVSRIREPEILTGRFIRRPLSFEEFEQLQNQQSPGKTTELVLLFHPFMKALAEEYAAPEDCSLDSEGNLIVKMRIPEDGWLYGLILSYGEYVTVLEPAHVREQVKEIAEKIAGKYEN